MIWYIMFGVLAYLAAGIATTAMKLLEMEESDPRRDEPLWILVGIFLWPIHLVLILPAYIARRIRTARDRKPAPLPEDEWRS